MRALRLHIAGRSFALSSPDHPVVQALARRWAPFVGPDDGPAEALELTWELPRPRAEQQQQQRAVPQVSEGAGGEWTLEGDGFRAAQPGPSAPVRVWLSPEPFPIESVLRMRLARAIQADGGLLVHGVGVAAAEGALFTGPSGAGKSTLGALCDPPLRRLSDELVAVRPEGAGYRLSGTPWNIGQPHHAPLRMLGLLWHAPQATLEDHPGAEVMRVLIGNCLLPDGSVAARTAAFRNASRVLAQVRPVRLGFALDRQVGEVLARALA